MQLWLEFLEDSLIVVFPELLRCVFASHSLEDCRSESVDWTGRAVLVGGSRAKRTDRAAYSFSRLHRVSQKLYNEEQHVNRPGCSS